jgi:general secretion pathway protein E
MPKYRLVCEDRQIDEAVLPDRPIAIGRHPDNDIVIRDELASRFHCVVEPNGAAGFRVRDLGSRNGTFLNEQPVTDHTLQPGDSFRVGEHIFRLDVDGRGLKGRMRGGASENGDANRWVAELVRIIETLPPKSITATETVDLRDARGSTSDALAGDTAGPAAIRLLLLAAAKARATDVHLEPKSEEYLIRFRVDGAMVAIVRLPRQVGDVGLGLIRTACLLKPAGREAVQDGHFSAVFADRRVDYRASFTPSVSGQKLVLRILDLRETPRSLGEIGLSEYMLKRIRGVCHQDSGMILVCGPTGSGKTTTLYNCMREIDTEQRNVITIEDPVEYSVEGITQIPIDEDRGNSFHNLLRSVLRQDPDVILVGEIRDEETARTGMRAAMTGHLVFSTLHARDTIGSVFRLLDLGVEPYLVANSLNLVLAQRLVRVLCEHCKRAVPLSPAQATKMGRFAEGAREVYTPVGCKRCLKTGYRGREAIFELLDFNDDLRDVVLNSPTISGMRKIIEQGLFTTLQQSGWQLVARGVTSVEEVEQVAGNA